MTKLVDVHIKQSAILLLAAAVCAVLAVSQPTAADLRDLAGEINLSQNKREADSKDAKETKGTNSGPRYYPGPKKRLAVMDMEVKVTASAVTEPTTSGGVVSTTAVYIPPPTDFGTGLTEMLTTALVDSGRFILLERKGLADIQQEQALAASGAVDPTSAAQGGKLLGAQALVRGAVTEYTYRRSSTSGSASFLEGIGVGSSKAEAAVVLDVRLYDVATSQIIDSVKAEGRAKSSAVAVDVEKEELRMSASGFSQSPLGQATRQAIERAVAFIVKRMEEIPWEGRVADLDADESGCVTTLYINAGSRAGLKKGDKFEVLRPGREIIDPETKLAIGRAKDKWLGSCQIESLTKDLAVATPLEGESFQTGDIVRMVVARKVERAPGRTAVER